MKQTQTPMQFIEMIARMQLESEMPDGMPSEDAIATVNSLIEAARIITSPPDDPNELVQDEGKLDTFYTVTDKDTRATNSRSSRYPTQPRAEDEARSRLARGQADGVYILKAIALVERESPPIKVTACK